MFWDTGWTAFIKYDKDKDKPVINKAMMKKIWRFARHYRKELALLLFVTTLISILSLITPLLIRILIDQAIPHEDRNLVNVLGVILVSIPILNGLLGVYERKLNSTIGEGIIHDLRTALYEHIQKMSLHFFTKTRTGELMARFSNDILGAQQMVSTTLTTILTNVITFLVAIGIMLQLNWQLTLLAIIILPLFVFPVRYIAGILRAYRRQSMVLMAEANSTLHETLNISGVLLNKLFGQQKRELARFRQQSSQVRDNRNREAVASQWMRILMTVLGTVATAVVYWVGGLLILDDKISIGTMVAFGGYLVQLYTPLVSLTNAPLEFLQSMVSFERVFEILEIPVEIENSTNALQLEKAAGKIRFENVSFNYQSEKGQGLQEIIRFIRGGTEAHLKRGESTGSNEDNTVETWALNGINFTIEPGQLVALVGPSGAGKTTITYLIPRLYDPLEGGIYIDEHNIRDIDLSCLAANIGMVTQDTYLFYDTIRANLLYANPEASEEQMIAAAKAANIHEFITALPKGYDTVVGERGYRLSGGERQRISIARVILKNPRILVLDEATSHLDSISESLIQEALQRVMKDRTSIVIAHRLSTILAADKILVMESGRLVEEGTHEELLAKHGLYKLLYETQYSLPQEKTSVNRE